MDDRDHHLCIKMVAKRMGISTYSAQLRVDNHFSRKPRYAVYWPKADRVFELPVTLRAQYGDTEEACLAWIRMGFSGDAKEHCVPWLTEEGRRWLEKELTKK